MGEAGKFAVGLAGVLLRSLVEVAEGEKVRHN